MDRSELTLFDKVREQSALLVQNTINGLKEEIADLRVQLERCRGVLSATEDVAARTIGEHLDKAEEWKKAYETTRDNADRIVTNLNQAETDVWQWKLKHSTLVGLARDFLAAFVQCFTDPNSIEPDVMPQALKRLKAEVDSYTRAGG